MEGEQTWPTNEELKAGKGETHKCLKACVTTELWSTEDFKCKQTTGNDKRHVPAGTSEYQAAWIIEDSGESSSEDEVRIVGFVLLRSA